MKSVLIRFVTDWTVYAAGDEATFGEGLALQLIRGGFARAVEVPTQLDLQLEPVASPFVGGVEKRK